jgi:hypothetical protein
LPHEPQFCVSGFCQIVCPKNYTQCGQSCLDTNSDPQHCGSCFTQCGVNQNCLQGVCCNNGLVNCNGQCTDSTSDVNNCGSCGTKCSGGTPYCVNSACAQCPQGATLVNGHCRIVYHINTASQLDGLPYTCGNTHYSFSGAPYGFHWTDIFPANTPVTAMSVSFTQGYTYLYIYSNARSLQLNGTTVYNYNLAQWTSCAPNTTFSFNVSQLNAYQSGQTNKILMPSTYYEEGLDQNGGDWATVTVTF